MTEVTVTQIGNSKGVILPKEILAKLRVDKGDKLYITETPGGIQITPYDADFARTMEVAERIMREDRDVLKKLAE
ncbi:MAG TPA: AbrB/MazE/SpoVT family DNA-binding domain-containing protein [Rhodospirillaceae bacterium]|jgi:putative addiction module antidote|nr:AbrB/MazE/SpoVT family DNA-binding domain-containing protein [Rhodospirillaceae bacterium]